MERMNSSAIHTGTTERGERSLRSDKPTETVNVPEALLEPPSVDASIIGHKAKNLRSIE